MNDMMHMGFDPLPFYGYHERGVYRLHGPLLSIIELSPTSIDWDSSRTERFFEGNSAIGHEIFSMVLELQSFFYNTVGHFLKFKYLKYLIYHFFKIISDE